VLEAGSYMYRYEMGWWSVVNIDSKVCIHSERF
jgi:hypothetical protein